MQEMASRLSTCVGFASALLSTALLSSGCQPPPPPDARDVPTDIESISIERDAALHREFPKLLKRYGVVTAGVGVIQQGELVWTGYFGEQAPGVPASRNTLFDVASMTKTVTAETILRLVSAGRLSLDESIAPYWVDPDIVEDPRHTELTARIALTHSTGFLNWRFFAEDGVLRFMNDPGTTYGYSGEGIEYAARYAERKLGQDFESLVKEQIFTPLAMDNVSFSVRQANYDRIARAVDEDGVFHGYYCRPGGWCRQEGDYPAADDMVISIEDYATFMISAMNGEGLSERLVADRNRVQIKLEGEEAVVECAAVPPEACPKEQGYGLGWEVLDFGDNQLIGHGGSDWSETTLGYFYTRSRDGLILFLNAPNTFALGAMTEAIALLDPDSPMLEYYQRWYQQQLAGLD